MQENALPFQYDEIQAHVAFLESMNSILKDSDAAQEKEIIKNFLRKTADVFHFVVVGDSGTGKTTLLKSMFGEAVVYGGEVMPTTGIHEFRHGEESTEFQVEEGHLRIFDSNDMLKGISVVDTQGCNQSSPPGAQEKIKSFIEKSDVLIAVFQADCANSYTLWDLLEGVEARKVVCVLTKADLFSEDVVEQTRTKVRRYLADAGIEAPVFAISAIEDMGKWSESFQELKTYIDKHVIGENPNLKKQRENILALKEMLGSVSDSFQLRRRQYEADLAVLDKINHAMDGFLMESRETIDLLKDSLRREIGMAIDAYENEIIVKLDPKQVKERFPNGYSDFVDYLNYVNEGYRKKMTDNVNRKTQETIRDYLSQLEIVFDEATGYFRNRESILQLEDHFYGSMAKSKQGIVVKLENDLQETRVYYGGLASASEDMFMKIWHEREICDKRTENSAVLGGLAGSVAGVGSVYGVAALLHMGTAVSAGALMGSVGILWPVVAAIVGGVVISSMAKKIASAKNMEEMEMRVREAIDEFRVAVSNTKEQMTGQILETIETIFRRELDTADKTFLDFRKSVNIDGRNIPMLEDRMDQIQAFMQKIEQAEDGERLVG